MSAPAPSSRLLICGFGPFPGFPDNPASAVVERLEAERWAPAGARTAYRLIPTTWGGGLEAAATAARKIGADAVMVIGVAGGATAFRVESQGRNRAGVERLDAAGALHPGERISASGPEVAAATAPVQAIVAALACEGLPVEASDDAGDYLCNYVFYRLLTEGAACKVAFLHLPPGLDLDRLARGVKAAATALAETLAPAGGV